MLGSLTLGPKSVWFKVQIFNFWLQILNFRSKCLNLGSRSHFKLPNRNCQSQVWNFRSQALHFTSQIPKPPASTEVRLCQPGSLQVPVYQRMEGPPARDLGPNIKDLGPKIMDLEPKVKKLGPEIKDLVPKIKERPGTCNETFGI